MSDQIATSTGESGSVMRHSNGFELMLVPFKKERLPNPQHLAFEVDGDEFNSIHTKCLERHLPTRSEPSLQSPPGGPVTFKQGDCEYKHFYLLDPSGLNIEVMTLA